MRSRGSLRRKLEPCARMARKADATWWFSMGLASLYVSASSSLARTKKSLLSPLCSVSWMMAAR